MRYLALSFIVALAVLSGSARALPVPALHARVTDNAGVLTEAERSSIESTLAKQEAESSNQIAVLTIPSLEGDNLESFAQKVFDSWKLGDKKRDNGVLLLISVNDRKMRIHVGYGLEGALNDGKAGEIIRNELAPAFKEKRYADGINAGIAAIVKAIKGEYKGSGQAAAGSTSNPRLHWLWGALVVLFIAGAASEDRPHVGGVIGAIGCGIFTLIATLSFPLCLLGIAVGYILGMISNPVLDGVLSSDGSSSSYSGSSGGGGGGGWSGGGGSSGGGGASGSW